METEFEVGKCYKHLKGLLVKVVELDPAGYVVIKYSTGKVGKLIPKAPGWEEVSKEVWVESNGDGEALTNQGESNEDQEEVSK